MTEFSSDALDLGDGLVISGQGLRGDASPGVQGGQRGGEVADPLADDLGATEGFRLGSAATISHLALTGSGTNRDGTGADTGALSVTLPRAESGERQAVLIEENGEYAWFFPDTTKSNRRQKGIVEIPIEATGTTRGLGGWGRKILRVVAVKALGKLAQMGIGAIDERRNPYQIRPWTPDDYQEPEVQALEPNSMSGPEPILLIVHGFNGGIATSFSSLDRSLVEIVHREYGGRTMAFGHPTFAMSPRANAEWFLDQLDDGAELTFDIMAHSRGGLVAREIADVLASATGKRVRVRRIVFVATPNDGTPLADTSKPEGLLDSLTNLVDKIPGGQPYALATGLVTDILFDGVLANLHGITAMHPDGDYLAALNARGSQGFETRSISTEFEPRSDAGFVKTKIDGLLDAYFGGLRNDRVVPTIATHVTRGDFHIPPGQRLVLDSSRSIHHSSFWDNGRVEEQLEKWLRPEWDTTPVADAETDQGAEFAKTPDPATIASVGQAIGKLGQQAIKSVEDLVGGPIDSSARPRKGSGEAVVVLPGIMGSYLRSTTLGSTIWVSARSLNRGHFGRLLLGEGATDQIETAGVHRTYLPLVSKLAVERDVFVADYDWRLDIRESADRLADIVENEVLAADPGRTVHFVAHSMGGLVARTFAHRHPELWKRTSGSSQSHPGRLVMLGTPNRGSYAMILTLTGDEGMLKVLAAADFANRQDDLVDIVASFPGVYQLLPAFGEGPGDEDDDLDRLYVKKEWGTDAPVRQELLDSAKSLHADLADTIDPERLVYVAGYGTDTPYRVKVADPGEFSIGRFKAGDGRVPLALGVLDGVSTYYSPAGHGALIGDAQVLSSLKGLLEDGETKHLEAAPPARRGDEPDGREMVPAADFDLGPVRLAGMRSGVDHAARSDEFEFEVDRALGTYLGGSADVVNRSRLRVKMVHASLEKTNYPVAVGHYMGVPPEGAEGFLDWRLDGALTHRQRAGIYPERAGTAAYIEAPVRRRPKGAIVLGLGEFGSLTQRRLADAMREGTVAAALHARERNDTGGEIEIGIASVLVGSPGRYGVTVKESVTALTEGVMRAMIELRRLDVKVAITELELIELYELRAEEAAYAMRLLDEELPSEVTAVVDIDVVAQVEVRDGGRSGGPSGQGSGTPWVRMLVEFPGEEATSTESIRRMEVSTLERGAQANRLEHRINLPKIEAFVREAVRRTEIGSEVSRTLFELLFPHRTKLDLDRSENLHLILDEHLAQVPWELVADRDDRGSVRPLALRAGMLRQLRSSDVTREQRETSVSRQALVIGDPPTSLSRLPGARDEAVTVADALVRADYEVTERIYTDADEQPAWVDIENALLARPYNIVHIAAHGVYDESADGVRSGVVIGPEDHHRLSVLDFQAMSSTPDLVFLNSCHLGRLGSFLDDQDQDDAERDRRRASHGRPAALAASVARQLMKNGVKAVVVAGWAVDDLAAKAFSERLYERLLGGTRFGDAVASAREAARAADGGRSNTWGAYQCYGDPDFRLSDTQRRGGAGTPPVGEAELRRWVEAIGSTASDTPTERSRERLRGDLADLLARSSDLADSASVQQALGRALGDLGDYEGSIEAYRNSLRHRSGGMTLRSIEQLANFEVRYAAELVRTSTTLTIESERVKELLDASKGRLDWLIGEVGETGERYALLGSYHKKLASILHLNRGDDAEGVAAARTAALRASYQAYESAWEISSKDRPEQRSYHTLLWLQMRRLSVGRRGSAASDRAYEQIRQQLTKAAERHDEEYWDIAATADLAITDAVIDRDGWAEHLRTTRERYLHAFLVGRSSVPQRNSVVEHLRDLAALLGDPYDRDLEALADELGGWSPE